MTTPALVTPRPPVPALQESRDRVVFMRYLGFDLRLRGDCSQNDIEQNFEFAIDDCGVQVLPSHADAQRYPDLIYRRCAGDADARPRPGLLDLWQPEPPQPAPSP